MGTTQYILVVLNNGHEFKCPVMRFHRDQYGFRLNLEDGAVAIPNASVAYTKNIMGETKEE